MATPSADRSKVDEHGRRRLPRPPHFVPNRPARLIRIRGAQARLDQRTAKGMEAAGIRFIHKAWETFIR